MHAQAGGATHGNAQLQGTGLWVTGSGGQLAQQLQAGALGQGKGLEAFGWLQAQVVLGEVLLVDAMHPIAGLGQQGIGTWPIGVLQAAAGGLHVLVVGVQQLAQLGGQVAVRQQPARAGGAAQQRLAVVEHQYKGIGRYALPVRYLHADAGITQHAHRK